MECGQGNIDQFLPKVFEELCFYCQDLYYSSYEPTALIAEAI